MTLLKKLFGSGRSGSDEAVSGLYSSVMGQALQPAFFGDGLAPDTFAGRFEVVTLHAVLVFRRLRSIPDLGPELAQQVFDVLFDGFDDALREIGTGDLTVGKKIRNIAEAFYGRARAYDAAMEADAPEGALSEALGRNMKLDDASSQRLAEYMRAADALLAEQPSDRMLIGRIDWPDAEWRRA